MKTGKMLVGSVVAVFLVAMAALALARGPESAQQALAPASSGVRVAASSSPSPTPSSSPSPTPSSSPSPTASSSPSPTPSPDGTFDISGPCDEAEHINDPRCAGVQVPTGGAQVGGVDISGPCDEAEHINDPRCTQPGAGEEDRSGPSHGEQDDRSGSSNDGNDEDNSGPSGNSGPGSSSDND
jgi:hypothetical protein